MEATTAMNPVEPAQPDALDLHAEDGAQAVEYAMIGGLGAGLIGLLWTIISRTEILDRVVEALLAALVELVGSWF